MEINFQFEESLLFKSGEIYPEWLDWKPMPSKNDKAPVAKSGIM